MSHTHSIDKVRNPMKSPTMTTQLRRISLMLMLVFPLSSLAAEQLTFPTPEAALDAVEAALKSNDESALLAIFGDKHKSLIVSGDPANDRSIRAEAAARLSAFHALEEYRDDRRVILMGAEAWPFPIPLAREGSHWRFATEEGAEELVNRRIGANERNAITVAHAYLDAQREYAAQDRDGDGVRQYAQKIASTQGKQDGLYWPVNVDREEPSPFGPLIAESASYLAGHKHGDPYRGYYFKILTRQGRNAAGGAYNYIINGRMIAGFALVAYPARYGESGVMTFVVNHNGKVYEKDLGRDSKSAGEKMKNFNPDKGWKEVAP